MFKIAILSAAVAGMYIAPIPQIVLDDPDYTFRHELGVGQTLAIGNIEGSITLTRTSGRTAEVRVTKRVIRGNGNLVKAILEESSDGFKVCSVYLYEANENRTSCNQDNHGRRRSEPLEVEMTYEVLVPDGVKLQVATVDGDVLVTEVDASGSFTSVDGSITVTGRAPERVTTVDGNIDVTVTGTLPESMKIRTVDGSIMIAVPQNASFRLDATTVDGTLESSFPVKMSGKWGPRAMRGEVGGGDSSLRVSTVDGSITLKSSR
jgi:hypothetical protein